MTKLRMELDGLQLEMRHLTEAIVGAGCSVELARRLALIAPILARRLEGADENPEMVLRRNVAAHACELPAPGTGAAAWRAAQKGPRLEGRRRVPGSCGEAEHDPGCLLDVQAGPVREWMPAAHPIPPGFVAFGPRHGGAVLAAERSGRIFTLPMATRTMVHWKLLPVESVVYVSQSCPATDSTAKTSSHSPALATKQNLPASILQAVLTL